MSRKQFHMGRTNFKRLEPHRSQRDRILIVCEDSVITPSYLKAFRSDKRLTNTECIILGEECSSDPESIYEFAK